MLRREGHPISSAIQQETEGIPFFFNVTFNLGQIMAANIKGKHITLVPRLAAPESLSPSARAIFIQIINNVDPSHFTEVDLPLLEGYANSAALSTEAAHQLDISGAVIDGKASPWLGVAEKAHKQLVALSARLRICPQSRFDRLSAGANSRHQLVSNDFEHDGLLAR